MARCPWKKLILAVFFYVLFALVLLPGLVCAIFARPAEAPAEKTDVVHDVLWNDVMPGLPDGFEAYIQGVVAAEMPAAFSIEALKAQAVAARTYAVRNMPADGGIPYQIGQAYITVDEQKKRWGDSFDTYYEKTSRAVSETAGEIMVYNNEPILAAFHAQSGGMTEQSENVWKTPLPYLKSVDSSMDAKAPNFETACTLTTTEVLQRLEDEYGATGLTAETIYENLHIDTRSKAGYIQKISIGSLSLTGLEVRTALGLRSANFTITQQDPNTITFTTKGYGHGAGMSQYGAGYLAEDGKTYREILSYYYQGVDFVPLGPEK